MNKKEYKNYLKRYDKFRKNNLPTSFWDDERQILEYVYFENEEKLRVNTLMYEAISTIADTILYYPFNSKQIIKEIDKEPKIEYGHNHAHSFEEVVRCLYTYPESFNIEKEDEEYYSKQQLEYLRRVQKYLLFIGLKDNEGLKIKQSRYRNKKQKKYGNCLIFSCPTKTIDDLSFGKRNFTYLEAIPDVSKNREYDDFYALLTDEEDNFKLYIKYISQEVKKYSEIKDIVKDDRFKDDDMIVVRYLEILEKF